jgi:citrate synthase
MSEKAILTLGGSQYEFPVVVGTEGERAFDIRDLRSRTGHITLDPGYANTGSCESAITFIDGEHGILRYRGIPIEQLADGPTFVEVAWLLILGQLPSEKESRRFSADLMWPASARSGGRSTAVRMSRF